MLKTQDQMVLSKHTSRRQEGAWNTEKVMASQELPKFMLITLTALCDSVTFVGYPQCVSIDANSRSKEKMMAQKFSASSMQQLPLNESLLRRRMKKPILWSWLLNRISKGWRMPPQKDRAFLGFYWELADDFRLRQLVEMSSVMRTNHATAKSLDKCSDDMQNFLQLQS